MVKLLLVSSLLLGLIGPPAVGVDPLERALLVLETLDATELSVRYRDEPLASVLHDLNEQLDVAIRVDWDALDRLGTTPDATISLELTDAPASFALVGLLLQLGDELERPVYEVHADQVVITSVGGTEAMRLTDAYDVRDLLADDRALEALRASAPPIPGAEDNEAGDRAPDDDEPDAEEPDADGQDDDVQDDGEDKSPEGDGPPPARRAPPPSAPQPPSLTRPQPPSALPAPTVAVDVPARPLTAGEELMHLIMEHVEPDAWMEYGGSRATISERDGILLVSAPPTIHRKFQRALARLRRATPTAVHLEAAIVDLPRSDFVRLLRRLDPTRAALGRAVLHAPTATVRWRTVALVAMDERLVVESEAGGLGLAVKLAVTPTFDADKGLLRLAVSASTADEGGELRLVQTTVIVVGRQGGATLELPSTPPQDVVRVLVLLPERR